MVTRSRSSTSTAWIGRRTASPGPSTATTYEHSTARTPGTPLLDASTTPKPHPVSCFRSGPPVFPRTRRVPSTGLEVRLTGTPSICRTVTTTPGCSKSLSNATVLHQAQRRAETRPTSTLTTRTPPTTPLKSPTSTLSSAPSMPLERIPTSVPSLPVVHLNLRDQQLPYQEETQAVVSVLKNNHLLPPDLPPLQAHHPHQTPEPAARDSVRTHLEAVARALVLPSNPA